MLSSAFDWVRDRRGGREPHRVAGEGADAAVPVNAGRGVLEVPLVPLQRAGGADGEVEDAEHQFARRGFFGVLH